MRERPNCQDEQLLFLVKREKCGKIKKDSKNHSSKTIDCTEFCWASSERGELALSQLLISCVVPFGPKKASTFPKDSQEKGKTKFLRRSQKAEGILRLFSKLFFFQSVIVVFFVVVIVGNFGEVFFVVVSSCFFVVFFSVVLSDDVNDFVID